MALVGGGTAAESSALQTALEGLAEADFARLRVCYEVPGRPRGPHVSATELIESILKTGHSNASHIWSRLKTDGFLNVSGRHIETFRFPGQRGGRPSEVIDIPTALQTIMVLPGKTAAQVRVKASVLLTRFLAGDLALVSEVYGMNELQNFLREHHPDHPLCAFRQSVEAGQTQELHDPEALDLERRAKRARILREIAAYEEAVAASNAAAAVAKEKASRAREIVSVDLAERGMLVFNQIHSMTGLDDRERTALRARVTTSLLGVDQPQPARCEVIIENFLRDHRTSVNSSAFGRKAAAIWRNLHPGEEHPTKRIVLSNGQATDVNIYYEDEIATVLVPALQQCSQRPSTSAAPVGGDLRRLFRRAD
jgi:hypothetical protein